MRPRNDDPAGPGAFGTHQSPARADTTVPRSPINLTRVRISNGGSMYTTLAIATVSEYSGDTDSVSNERTGSRSSTRVMNLHLSAPLTAQTQTTVRTILLAISFACLEEPGILDRAPARPPRSPWRTQARAQRRGRLGKIFGPSSLALGLRLVR